MSIVLEAPPQVEFETEMPIRRSTVSRILLIDPCDEYRSGIEELVDYDFALGLEHVESAAEALMRIAEDPPLLILSEIDLPDMSGFDLVREIRSRGIIAPVILLAAKGSEDSALQAFAVGAVSYLPKRHLLQKLSPIIESLLATAKKQRVLMHIVERIKRYDTHFVCENKPSLVAQLIEFIQDRLEQLNLMSEETKWMIGIALEEAILNGIYHGNLELSSDLKQDGSNRFYELAEARLAMEPYASRKLHIDLHLDRTQACIVIRDEGTGFDVNKLADCTIDGGLERASGRGILMIRSFMDEVIYNETGNEITLIKRKI